MKSITVKTSPPNINPCIGWLKPLILASTLFNTPSVLAVNQTRSLEIESEIIKFIQKNSHRPDDELEIEVNKLAPKLKLKPCAKKWAISYAGKPTDTGQVLLKVQCATQPHWKTYLSAKIDYNIKVLTSTRSLPKNSVLTAKDLHITQHKLSNLVRGYYSNQSELNGLQTKRTLRKNQVISPYHLKKQDLIQSGDTILLIAQGAGISVSMKGRALNKGAKDDNIRVKNSRSGRIIEARVIRNGVAAVIY